MDMQKIPPIHQKRIITFVNHFVVTTVSFLNKFVNTCESTLSKLDRRMETLEATICLLETKLNSIPNLPQITQPEKVISNEDIEVPAIQIKGDTNGGEDEINAETNNEDEIPPELMKYRKMCQVGVPIAAVKLKMQQDGYDPNLLDI